ncbi:uncharacterized protein LOC129798086 [Phlebotomus papatasi]|uniref:uncharacterized protein LOC129798086 n=1 Tax=Phlebotomus papatasi TaxID=29031 RepID=UPI002483A15A|nr:uncharacterized protein LOC129798086 [Phlebotomus papatasi]
MSKRCCASTCFNSQVNDKSGKISYFGVPKYEEYATKWLTAAGREDLLSKPLLKLVKYFICSDHFEADCFLPGSKRSVLKKQMHPLEIPVPTIFKSNIDKFVPKGLLTNPQDESFQDQPSTPSDSKATNSPPKIKILNQTIFRTDVTYDELEPIEASDFEILEECLETNEDEDPETGRQAYFANLCRLCSQKVDPNENFRLVPIFKRKDIVDMLNVILPNVIQEDDGWPQDICDLCLEKVKLCYSLVSSFIEAQDNFLNVS